MSLKSICGICWVALFAHVAMADGLSVTAPRHFRAGPSDHPTAPQRDARQASPRELPSSVLLHEDRDRRITAMKPDRRLSTACRAGLLRQYRDRQFVVQLGGYVHGAAFGGHWSLIDPEGQATPGQIYAFRRPNSGLCEIYRVDR
jgi:hypothetical protein